MYVASRVALGATTLPEDAGTANKLQPECLIYRRQIVELPNVEVLDLIRDALLPVNVMPQPALHGPIFRARNEITGEMDVSFDRPTRSRTPRPKNQTAMPGAARP